jgi:O-antigen/teichoic acid export membrane protein
MIMVTLAAPLFLLAGEVVELLFGDRWASAGRVLQVLALVIPLRGLSLIFSTFFWGLNRPKDVAMCTTLEAIVFLASLYPLITAFGLTGAAWAGVIAYSFACVVRLIALSEIIPGIAARLFRISVLILAAAGAGLLIGGVSLRFVTSPLLRVLVGGLLATSIPMVILLSVKADFRRWLVEESS